MSGGYYISPVGQIVLSDKAIKRAFETLSTRHRFHDILQSYFANLSTDASQEIEELRVKKYKIVQSSIAQLWERARKSADFLEFTQDFEPLLKELGLRDHFVHSFNVFLIGYFIINKIEELYPNKNYFRFNEDNANLTWMLTATFHDVAYAVEKTDEWLNKFFKNFLGVDPHFALRVSEILTPVYIDFIRMLSQYHKTPFQPTFSYNFESIDWGYYNTICNELSNKNHGVLSALMLCHRMAIKEGFLGETTRRQGGREWDFLYYHLCASHAISLHNVPSIAVKLAQHPFAFLLILCDEIQNWGRYGREAETRLDKIEVKGLKTPRVYLELYESDPIFWSLVDQLKHRLDIGNELKLSINGVDVNCTKRPPS